MRQKRSHLISPAGLRVVDALVGRRPQTIVELLGRLEVTRTAITEQLDELVAGGWVVRERESLKGRGRPRFKYSLAPDAVASLYPAGVPGYIVPRIWEVLEEIGGQEYVDEIVEKLAERLVNFYGEKLPGPTVRERFVQAMEFMAPYGEQVKVVECEDGTLEICRYACEVCAINDKRSTLCKLHMQIMEKLLPEAEVINVYNRCSGNAYCLFKLIEVKEKPDTD